MKKGLIFDLDGTLVDSLPGIAASLNHALAACGFAGHGEREVRGFIGNGSWMLAKRALPEGVADEVVGEVEQEFKKHYDANWMHGTVPFAGVSELLADLSGQGRKLAVLSNKPHPFTTVIVERLFPGIRFDAVMGQKAGVPHKPDPAGAFGILREFGLGAGECVLVGDSTVDLETARNAGIDAVAVTWGYHDRAPLEAMAEVLADDVSGLLAALC